MYLPFGALCDTCRREIARRAGRVARWTSLLTTLGFGLYVMLVLPPDRTARLVGAAATVTWYLLVRRIAQRVASAWFRERP